MSVPQGFTADSGNRLALRTLGAASLERILEDGSRELALGPGKPLGLLAYLAFSPGRTATREHLTDVLWSELDPDAARHSLRHTLWLLRRHLGDDGIVTTDGSLRLAAPIESDRDDFLAGIDQPDFERAVEVYRGEFLPAFAAPGAADLEQWADVERYRLRHLFLRAAESVVRDWLTRGRWRWARQLAARARDSDRDNQGAWRLLLECLLASNDRIAAELEAHELEEMLRRDGKPPEPATARMLERVRVTPDSQSDSGSAEPRSELVADLIGREAEFSALLSAWDRVKRGTGQHSHIVGAAGLGKTRLLADVHARLRSIGARCVAVRANPGERQVAYALTAELAAAAAVLPGAKGVPEAVAAALVALNPALSAQYPVAADRATDSEALRHREIALRELLAAVAYEQPLAVLLDDVHWADAQSGQLLRSVVERVAEWPLLVVTSTRPGGDGAWTGNATVTATLTPFTADQTVALVESLGRLPPDPWAVTLPSLLHANSEGSPLLALETLRLTLESGLLTLRDGQWDCSDTVVLKDELERGGALRRRIELLGPRQRYLLVVLALAGAPIETQTLAAVAECSPDAVQDDLSALEVRGLAAREPSGWAPAHDLIAERAVDVASLDAQRTGHRALGLTLSRIAGEDTGLLFRAGRHLALAGEAPPLSRTFGRWAGAVRRDGDRRSLRALASEMVKGAPSAITAASLARRAPLRLRLGVHSTRRLGLAVGVTALGLAAAMWPLVRRTEPPPDADLLVVRGLRSDSARVWRLGLRREGWDRLRAIDVAKVGRELPGLAEAARRTTGMLIPRRDGRAWIFSALSPDSGGTDVYSTDESGRVSRLTDAPKDDYAGSWSPDGKDVVFGTCRWNVHCWADLAVLDLQSRRIRQITSGDATDGVAKWSPDGTRMAFTRADHRGSGRTELCWVAVDGSNAPCFEPAGQPDNVLAWYDRQQIVVELANGGRQELVRVNLDTRESHVLAAGVLDPQVSPDGRWVACRCGPDQGAGRTWAVFPSDRPDLLVPVVGPDSGTGPGAPQLFWASARGTPAPLSRLSIEAPPGALPVGGVVRLRAVGFDELGDSTPVSILRWWTGDQGVASLDSTTGDLRPRQSGSVAVHASAGGWRDANARIEVTDPVVSPLFSERWAGTLADAWVPYGEPQPLVVAGPGDSAALWNRGDGDFLSGVYSRQTFTPSGGLGLEVEVTSPLNALQDQIWAIHLIEWGDFGAVTRWDHRSGGLPLSTARECRFAYPAADGVSGREILSLSSDDLGHSAPALPPMPTGRPYVVRIQIFPDGGCGIAINGKALWAAPSRLPLDRPYRVVLEGKSVGTRMLIGPLTVWGGVKPGVPWAEAPR